jgi:hypothetical protein
MMGRIFYCRYLTLVHTTHGVLFAGMFLVIDAMCGRPRVKQPVVLSAYAASFGFAVDAGLGAMPMGFAALLILTILLLFGAAVAAGTKAKQIPSTPPCSCGVISRQPQSLLSAFRTRKLPASACRPAIRSTPGVCLD